MVLGIDYLYADHGAALKRYIRLGWLSHFKALKVGPLKLSTLVERKMKARKIPPHLKGTEVRVYTDKKKFYIHRFMTDAEKSVFVNSFNQLLKLKK